MTARTLEADYLVVGSGAAGMAFTDAQIEWTADGAAQFERILAAVPPPVRDWIRANQQRVGLQLPLR